MGPKTRPGVLTAWLTTNLAVEVVCFVLIATITGWLLGWKQQKQKKHKEQKKQQQKQRSNDNNATASYDEMSAAFAFKTIT